MAWFSVPPQSSVGTIFSRRIGAGHAALHAVAFHARHCELGAAGVLQRDGKAADAEEIELIGDRVKERLDGKRDERNLHAAREHDQIAQMWFARGAHADARRAAECRDEQPDEQRRTRQPEVDGVLEVDVVDRPPGRAALFVERQDVLTEADAGDRILDDDVDGRAEVFPAPWAEPVLSFSMSVMVLRRSRYPGRQHRRDDQGSDAQSRSPPLEGGGESVR